MINTENTVYIGQKGVYFGIYLKGDTPTSVLDYKSYIDIKATQYTTYNNYSSLQEQNNSTELATELWGNRYAQFFDAQVANYLNIDQLIWTQSLDYAIGGNSLSAEYNYISISISKCSAQSYWKSDAEIYSALGSAKIGVAITDYYFDSNNYDNPIQMNPSSNFEYAPTISMKKTLNIMIRK